jgi:ribose transport system permease protein
MRKDGSQLQINRKLLCRPLLDQIRPHSLGPVLGGAGLAGGFVSVGGTMLGAALVTTIRSGLLVMGIGSFWLDLFLGLFLLAAVLLQRYRGVLSRMQGG